MLKKIFGNFTVTDYVLWGFSVAAIILSDVVFGNSDALTLVATLFGVTSLIFYAKGNPVGPVLMFVFCVIYGIISYSYAYYGELITYVFMSLPMAVFTLVSWLKHPSKEDKSQVEINVVSLKETVLSFVAALVVTAVFYFILSALHTTNIVFSTISVTTSFIAVYFSFRRSPYYALGYAANDIVLIILWVLASRDDKKYISVVVCFAVFLINDLYGFFSWQRRKNTQNNKTE